MFAASLAFFLYSYLVRFGRPAAGASVLVPVAIDTALFTLFALHHSLFARPFVKRWLFGVRPGSDTGQTGVRHGSDRRSDPPGAADLRLGRERALHRGLRRVAAGPRRALSRDRRPRACGVCGSRRRHRPHGARLCAPRRSRPRRRARGLSLAPRDPRAAADARRLRLRPPPGLLRVGADGDRHATHDDDAAHLRHPQHCLPRNCHTVRGTRACSKCSARNTGNIRNGSAGG